MRNRFRSLVLLMILGWISNLTGCIPRSDLQNIVVTEDVLYLSGEVTRLSGRVIEADGTVDDHGFYISTDEMFSSPTIISLGPKEDGLGRFIGEYTLLNINTRYFYRSFANINGSEVYGQTKEFSSLKPRIDSFTPDNGIQGNLITISGINFTHDTKVFIGGTEAEVVSIEGETKLEARVPAIGDSEKVGVVVSVQDTTMSFTNEFYYHIGHWNLETTFFDNLQLYEAMAMKVGDEFIYGLGAESDFTLNQKIWSLDLVTYTWTDLNFAGNTPARLSFNSGSYWGGGLASEQFSATIISPYFWQYNNGSFTLKPFLPFSVFNSVSMELNGDIFIFGGQLVDFSSNLTFYQYQDGSGSWTSLGTAPIEILAEYPHFAYNNEAYFVLPDGIIWRYNPDANDWFEVAAFPESLRPAGIAVVLNGIAYIGLFENSTQLWAWDINNNTWIKKTAIPANFQDINTGYFSHDNKVFVFRSKSGGGQNLPDPKMELWSLDPKQLK